MTDTYRVAPDDDIYALLTSAAFGTLSQEEASALGAYLPAHPETQAELASLQSMVGDLSLLADEREPSPALRDRIARSIQSQVTSDPDALESVGIHDLDTSVAPPEKQPIPITRRRITMMAASIAATIALIVGGLVGWLLPRQFEDDTPTSESVSFELTTPVPNLSATLSYRPNDQMFVLDTSNMPPAPDGKVYQVWLIDANGPKPAGVMSGSTFAVAADRSQYTTFAITVEPGPLGSDAPTSSPFFVAPLIANS